MTSLDQILVAFQSQVDRALERQLPPAERDPVRLHTAMRYAVLGPGKRVRPVLVYATGQALNTHLDELDASAVAVELIHAYSLIHDDLPAMDDDDLRRGRPTCHKEFDEATAILAGDALQALAFSAIAECEKISVPPSRRIEMLRALAQASGSEGMAGGQAMDLAAVGNQLTLAELETMHLHKTGALIRASVQLGYLASQINDPDIAERLDRYARCVGLAFQVHDDILDVEGETAVIGKPQGSDSDQNKPTYPNILGMDEAKKTAQSLCDEAISCLDQLGPSADTLRQLADYIVNRDR
jgi:geranylgeranyl pyrophosphate synthase